MRGASRTGKPLQDHAQVEATVEQVLNLCEVSMRVFGEAKSVVSAGQESSNNNLNNLEISDRAVA